MKFLDQASFFILQVWFEKTTISGTIHLQLMRYILKLKKTSLLLSNRVLLYLPTVNIILLIVKFGFRKEASLDLFLIDFFEISLVLLLLALLVSYILSKKKSLISNRAITNYLLILLLLLVTCSRLLLSESFIQEFSWLNIFQTNILLYVSLVLIFLFEISSISLKYQSNNLKPARIFIYSFALLVLTGTGLLLLPTATVNGITIIDALFTATSAVCVTGLTVVDTYAHFTKFGKIIILVLIQAGGLGVMTFTSFFGFLFHGGFTLKNELFLQNILQEERMGEIFKTILKILFITLGIELGAGILIYFSLSADLFNTSEERIFFSVFHGISAFCNAGFSTFSNGLYEESLRFNYYFLLVIAFTIILGGLGFPIVFNYYRYLKHFIKNKWKQIVFGEKYIHAPRIININTKLVLTITSILIFFGSVFYYLLEYNNTLQEHVWYGKIVASFFGAVTPRTAGFNAVNMSMLAPGTILIYLFLMWIGASPGSTGGGIKTTTFGIAILNTLAIAKGQTRLEIFRREIANESIQRALAIIILSFIVIGSGIILITLFDPDKELAQVIFECFSAFSTTGLSLGITSSLSSNSKIIIILLMFIGRVGALTIIIGFVKKAGSQRYSYPKENIFIN